MLSKDFLNGIEFELQNRAFALKAITRISNRMQGTPEHVFWNAYERLENFNTAIYSAYAEMMCAELTGDFHLGDSRQLTDKSLLPFDLVS